MSVLPQLVKIEKENGYSEKPSEPSVKSECDRKCEIVDSYTSENRLPQVSIAYRVIEFYTIFWALSNMLVCKKCKGDVRFEEKNHEGLGFRIFVKCGCGDTVIPSCPKIPGGYEVNARFVFAMRMCGQSLSAVNLFCNLMNLCQGFSKKMYENIGKCIHESAKKVFEISCKNAIEDERKENEKLRRSQTDLKVSLKGDTWKKRGFQTLFGVVPLMAYYSGKIIDLVVESRYCLECLKNVDRKNMSNDERDGESEWFFQHLEGCRKSEDVSVDVAKTDATLKMFLDSEEKFGVKYREYDGDSNTFNNIIQFEPYGEECSIKKFDSVVYKKSSYESLHATIWRLASKHQSHRVKENIETAAYLAAALFNDGFSSLITIMSDLEISISREMQQYVELVDTERAKHQSERQSTCSSSRLKSEEEACKRIEGLLYTPEIAE